MIPVDTSTRTETQMVCANGRFATPGYSLKQLDNGKCWGKCGGVPHRLQERTITTIRTEWVDVKPELKFAERERA